MDERCVTDVKYEFHGMDMDIYKDFSPSEEYKMTEYTRGLQHGIIIGRRSVEPKHGRWIYINGWVECSCCHSEPPNECNIESDYCPNCGAKMDGEENE